MTGGRLGAEKNNQGVRKGTIKPIRESRNKRTKGSRA